MIRSALLMASLPLLLTACNSDGTSAISPHASISASSPDGGGALGGTNPDRKPAGSASISVTSPDGGGVVAGTPRATTAPAPNP